MKTFKAKHFFLAVLVAAFSFSLSVRAQQAYRVLSPDGLTYLDVKVTDGRLTYSAGYRNLVKAKKKGAVPDTLDVPVVLESPLGLYTNVVDFSKDLTFVQEERPEGIPTSRVIICVKASRAKSTQRREVSSLCSPTPRRRSAGWS